MTYQEASLPNVENIGSVDRVHRIIAGMALISVAVMFTAIPETGIAGIVAVGTYMGLTAFIGWDPLYAVVKAFLPPTSVPLTTTVVSHQRQDQRLYTGGYKQAA